MIYFTLIVKTDKYAEVQKTCRSISLSQLTGIKPTCLIF